MSNAAVITPIRAMYAAQHTLYCINTYREADKSLTEPGRKQATATEDFEFLISYL
jgi:hypothetical protein